MKFIEISKEQKNTFEEFINDKENATCMQMWEWKDFRNSLIPNLYKRVGVIEKDGKFSLTANYFINRFPPIGNILYIPQGPIWDKEDSLELFVQNITSICQQEKCIAVITEPRIKPDSKKHLELTNHGFIKTNKAVQPRSTVLLDLRKDSTDLLKDFSKSTRYNIRYAKRKKVKVKSYNSEKDINRIDDFYELLRLTQKRKYFHVQKLDYFRNLWKYFSRNKHISLYEAWYDRSHLGSIICIYNNVWNASLFSASSKKYSKMKPLYLARWESILDAKKRGAHIYDFFGATDSKDKSHPFYKTTQYKLGFGREVTNYAGTYELIIDKMRYNAWQLLTRLNIKKFYEENHIREFRKKNR